MNYTKRYMNPWSRKDETDKGIKAIIMILFAALLFPIGGTNYIQILFAYYVFLNVLVESKGKVNAKDVNVSFYAFYFVVFLSLSIVIGLFNTIGPREIIADTISSSLPIVCFFIGNYYADKCDEKTTRKVIMAILVIQFVFGFFQNISEGFRVFSFNLYGSGSRLISYEAEDVGRAVGTLASPNYYGLTCVFLGTILICEIFEKNIAREKIKYYIYSFLVACCVLFSVSKTSIICISIVVVMGIIFSKSFEGLRKVFLLVFFIGLILYLIPQFEEYSNRIIDITSMTGRTDAWTNLLSKKLFADPFATIFGYGNGFATVRNLGSYPDSFYLIILFEQGLLGFFFYAVAWLLIIINVLNKRASVYKKCCLTLIIIVLLSDITAAITDMPNVAILAYYFIGRYSTLTQIEHDREVEKGEHKNKNFMYGKKNWVKK